MKINEKISINSEDVYCVFGKYKNIGFVIWKQKTQLNINGYGFACQSLRDAYDQIVDRIDNNRGVYMPYYNR